MVCVKAIYNIKGGLMTTDEIVISPLRLCMQSDSLNRGMREERAVAAFIPYIHECPYRAV